MRILYGVVGEGMGHATRSKVVCEYLRDRGHELKIVASNRAHAFLAKSFDDVVEIKGLTIRYVDNALDRDGTLAQNLLAAPALLRANISAYLEQVVHFEPHVVLTDFDAFAYYFGKRHRLPIVSIDNHQIIARCKHGDDIKAGHKLDYQLTKAFVRAKVPGCDKYIITSFFEPPIRKKCQDDTILVPPLLRREILDAKRDAHFGGHVLVYQTSTTDQRLIPALQKLPKERFLVYGLRRNEQLGNVTLKEFSEKGFVTDLAAAKAVIANGGLSLLSEAIYLGKPIYSVPVQNQFEQILNSRYLERLGYGVATPQIDIDVLWRFLRDKDKFAVRVAEHKQRGNEVFCETLDYLLPKLKKKGKKRRQKLEQAEHDPD
jgi:uncharacterized protein (TIGR00661 family)